MIRLAKKRDIPEIERIFTAARKYMKNTGNPNQWGEKLPYISDSIESLLKDELYVLEREQRVYATFAFTKGRTDHDYDEIFEGNWHHPAPYGTIHHLASDGSYPGVFHEVVKYCFQYIGYLRIDTHEDNHILQNLATVNGFSYCGIVYLEKAGRRLAFDKKNNLTLSFPF